jgi:hypothetical protein
VFLGLNNWLIVDLRPTAPTNINDVQESCYDVIEGLCRQMGEEIQIGQIGAVAIEDTATLDYYLVLFTTDAFSFDPENIGEASDDDTLQIEEGSLVVRAEFYLLMKGAPFWYVPPNIDNPSLLFRVQTKLAGNLKLHPVEPGIVDPPRNKKKVIEKAAAIPVGKESTKKKPSWWQKEKKNTIGPMLNHQMRKRAWSL